MALICRPVRLVAASVAQLRNIGRETMNASESIDAMVRSGLAPFLKTFGFRRRGNSFARAFAHGFDVLGVQKNPWGTKHSTSFTVNLGICWPRAQELLGRPIDRMPFTDSHCTVFRRVGCVMPERRDIWWHAKAETPLNSVQLDLLERVDRYVMPWFDWAHDINHSIQLAREYKLIDFIAALEKVREEIDQ
jgi:hypothetical protein